MGKGGGDRRVRVHNRDFSIPPSFLPPVEEETRGIGWKSPWKSGSNPVEKYKIDSFCLKTTLHYYIRRLLPHLSSVAQQLKTNIFFSLSRVQAVNLSGRRRVSWEGSTKGRRYFYLSLCFFFGEEKGERALSSPVKWEGLWQP